MNMKWLFAALAVFTILVILGGIAKHKKNKQVVHECKETSFYTIDGAGSLNMVWDCSVVDIIK